MSKKEMQVGFLVMLQSAIMSCFGKRSRTRSERERFGRIELFDITGLNEEMPYLHKVTSNDDQSSYLLDKLRIEYTDRRRMAQLEDIEKERREYKTMLKCRRMLNRAEVIFQSYAEAFGEEEEDAGNPLMWVVSNAQ